MQILLKNLLGDPLYQSATFGERVDMETYELILEIYGVNPNESYKVNRDGNSMWTFVGDSGVKHFMRLNKGTKDRFEVKLGFFDGSKPVYDKPNLYFNDSVYQYDKKVLNTHVKILTDEVVPYFFNQVPSGELDIPSIDKARYRLYKMMVERFLNKEKYKIENDDGSTKFTIKQNA